MTGAKLGLFHLLLGSAKRNKALVLDGSKSVSNILIKEYKEVFVVSQDIKNGFFQILRFSNDGFKILEVEKEASFVWRFIGEKLFDLVVAGDINKVLDAICKRQVSKNAYHVFLSNLRKNVQKGGKVILGFQNLLDAEYWYLRAFKRWGNLGTVTERQKGLTVWGCKRLFKGASFSNVRQHLAIPSHIEPKYTCSIDQLSRKWFYKEIYPHPEKCVKRAILNILVFFDIAHYFAPTFIIEAER